MLSRTSKEHTDVVKAPESLERQPLLSHPARLNIALDPKVSPHIPEKSSSIASSEQKPKTNAIKRRQPSSLVAKSLFKWKKSMTEPMDETRTSSRGRRSTKNETRWTTPGGTRKNRTIFTDEQHYALVAAYEADKYPTTIQKELLARQLGLAPIVVINWFQHRRQREPVKEKGGYVRNSPGDSRPASPTYIPTSTMDGDGIEAGSVPSISEFFATGTKPPSGSPYVHPNTNAPTPMITDITPPPAPRLPPINTQSIASTSQSGTPVTPTSSNGQKSAPYYGRMQTVRAPLPGENRQGTNTASYPKPLNSHVGTIRWELDPLYIAPYIDHGFKDAMIPKDPNAFLLRPSSAVFVRK